jgi:hypothetical protein
LVAADPLLSVTVTVNGELAVVVGVPLRRPLGDNVNQEGTPVAVKA